jgi:hypothetical protein
MAGRSSRVRSTFWHRRITAQTRLILGTTGSKGFSTVFWGVIATDQALHLSILAISSIGWRLDRRNR